MSEITQLRMKMQDAGRQGTRELACSPVEDTGDGDLVQGDIGALPQKMRVLRNLSLHRRVGAWM